MRQLMVAGNWKMNTSLGEAEDLASSLVQGIGGANSVERVLIPPFPWIVPVQQRIAESDLKVGAQNCYTEASGAFTGEVAPEMLAGICDYVIAGHSERRHVLGESNEFVGEKVGAILRAGLRPILCVGETLEERENGQAENVVDEQVRAGLRGLSTEQASGVVIAYEPVWAIGTGRAASADDAQEMSAIIRKTVGDVISSSAAAGMRILYGGSVKGENAAQFMACPDVDGALVGGASLKADDFSAIVHAAAEHAN